MYEPRMPRALRLVSRRTRLFSFRVKTEEAMATAPVIFPLRPRFAALTPPILVKG